MSSNWPPPGSPPPGPPPHGTPPYGPPPGPYGPPWGPPPRPETPAGVILARIAALTMIGLGLLVGLVGGSVLAVPSSMMITGCSGDTACLQQFFWVAALPFLGCGAGLVVGLIGAIVNWRTPWIAVWGGIALGLSAAGILAGLRIAGYWPPG